MIYVIANELNVVSLHILMCLQMYFPVPEGEI